MVPVQILVDAGALSQVGRVPAPNPTLRLASRWEYNIVAEKQPKCGRKANPAAVTHKSDHWCLSAKYARMAWLSELCSKEGEVLG